MEVEILFVCDRDHREKKPCVECRATGVVRCSHALKGPKAGQLCERLLCERCVSPMGLCPAHARILAKI